MDWVIGIVQLERQALTLTDGKVRIISLDQLCKVGLPSVPNRKRLTLQGDFSNWTLSNPGEFLTAFGLKLPLGTVNRHAVFSYQLGDRRVVVPALAFMRALFKPASILLKKMFTPGNVDTVSYVDRSATTPQVIVDDVELSRRLRHFTGGVNKDCCVRWLQTSASARRTAQSVHLFGASGWLQLAMPEGHFRMAAHGVEIDGTLYANQVALVDVTSDAADSATDTEERYIFHDMVNPSRTPAASVHTFHVPLRLDGDSKTTDEEWAVLSELLRPQNPRHTPIVHCQRGLLDAILFKAATGCPWRDAPKETWNTSDLTNTFRRWMLTGRLQAVLEYLESTRKQGTSKPPGLSIAQASTGNSERIA